MKSENKIKIEKKLGHFWNSKVRMFSRVLER